MRAESYIQMPKADPHGGAGSNNPLDRETRYKGSASYKGSAIRRISDKGGDN